VSLIESLGSQARQLLPDQKACPANCSANPTLSDQRILRGTIHCFTSIVYKCLGKWVEFARNHLLFTFCDPASNSEEGRYEGENGTSAAG
jgi:hypothetical protein